MAQTTTAAFVWAFRRAASSRRTLLTLLSVWVAIRMRVNKSPKSNKKKRRRWYAHARLSYSLVYSHSSLCLLRAQWNASCFILLLQIPKPTRSSAFVCFLCLTLREIWTFFLLSFFLFLLYSCLNWNTAFVKPLSTSITVCVRVCVTVSSRERN